MAMKWYIVQAHSNFEKKVQESLLTSAQSKGLGHLFEEVLVPTEQVIEVRRGRKVESERKYFPGYILVRMDLNDEAYHLVKNTPKVTGFLGASNKPMPVSEVEIARILGNISKSEETPRSTLIFEVGETVKVVDGHFQSFKGIVEDVNEDDSRLKVAINIFGRPTPVEFGYLQVEKID